MDLDKLGPIALFIVYMAISAWSKQKKAKQRSKPAQPPRTSAPSPIAKPLREVGGILDQLKKELFEVDEEPLVFQNAMPEYEAKEEAEEEAEDLAVEPEPTRQFVEGSSKDMQDHPLLRVVEFKEHVPAGQSLEAVLEPYTSLEQGIIMHEILGKPKAYLKNDEWFHRS